MLSKKLTALLLCVSIMLSACSISPKTPTTKIGDNNLSKEQILAELAELDKIEKKISENKGVNVTNVAALLLFWPGLGYTFIDAYDAQNKVDTRRNLLNNIYNKKFEKTQQSA